jgi:hypothetical protein
LKLRGSERTDVSSSPPRGTSPFDTLVVADSEGVLERQAAAPAAQIAASVRETASRRVCPVKSCPTGQEIAR